MQYTSYLNLYKPNEADQVAIDVPLADNFTAIDEAIQSLNSESSTVAGDTTFTYTNGVVTGITTPTSTITLNYDTNGVVTSIEEVKGTQTITTTFQYDVDGKVASVTTGVA